MRAGSLEDDHLSNDVALKHSDEQLLSVHAAFSAENNYFTTSSCSTMRQQNTVNVAECSAITAYSGNFLRYDDYSVIVYCNEDDNAWKMSMFTPSSCQGDNFVRNLTGSGTECSRFSQGTENYYFEVVCHSTQSPTLVPTIVPTVEPFPNNYDGILTIYDGYNCEADAKGAYLAMPINDFKCIPTYIDGEPVNFDMICDFDAMYPISLNLYDPAYPGCPDTALQSNIGFISQYECAPGQYYYNHTLQSFSIIAACGKNLIEDKCETVYNGVLLQSYTLLFFNVVLFSLLKLLAEEYILPGLFALLSWCTCGLFTAPTSTNTAAAQLQPASVTKNPLTTKGTAKPAADEVELGTVGKSNASIPMESKAIPSKNTDVDTTIGNNNTTRMDFSKPFLVFQGINAVVALVYAFKLRDTNRTGWHQYQNFYGFLLNSSFLTFFISLILRIMRDEDKEAGGILAFQGLSTIVIVLTLAPPFITHFVPGFIVYIWVVCIALGCCGVFYTVLQAVGTVLGLASNPKYEVFATQTVMRAGMIFFFQTFYTYMVFYYAYAASDTHDNQAITGEHYLGVVSHEYNLRSQTWCNFENALSDAKNGLVFFSWL